MSGPEISLMMEVVTHIGLVNLFPPPNYYTFKKRKNDIIVDMIDEEENECSSYNFEAVLSLTNSNQKIGKTESEGSTQRKTLQLNKSHQNTLNIRKFDYELV